MSTTEKLNESLMSSEDVGLELKVSQRTLARWRSARINLPFRYIAGRAKYEPAHVRQYKASTLINVAGFPPESHSQSNAA